MSTQVLMPALSPTMEEGTLAKWLVSEGQEVKAGDVIAEIETDKATMEVEAVDEGRLEKILVPAGTEGVKVNTPIALIAGEDDERQAAAAPAPANSERSLPSAAKVATASAGLGEEDVIPAAASSEPIRWSRASPRSRPAPRRSRFRCARPCAMPWPRRCGATPTCS